MIDKIKQFMRDVDEAGGIIAKVKADPVPFIVGLILVLLLAGSASLFAQTARIDDLPRKGIIITAVEFIHVPQIKCESGVYYYDPGDENKDGKIETCSNIEYDPCSATSAPREITRHVLAGSSCENTLCDGFSPQPEGC
jgi:hypothetical protein